MFKYYQYNKIFIFYLNFNPKKTLKDKLNIRTMPIIPKIIRNNGHDDPRSDKDACCNGSVFFISVSEFLVSNNLLSKEEPKTLIPNPLWV